MDRSTSFRAEKSDLYDKNLPAYKKKIDEISAKVITGATTVEMGYIEYAGFWRSIQGDEMLAQLNRIDFQYTPLQNSGAGGP